MNSAGLFDDILALMDKLYEDGKMRYAAYDSLWNALEAYAAKYTQEDMDKEEKQLDANAIQKLADSLFVLSAL